MGTSDPWESSYTSRSSVSACHCEPSSESVTSSISSALELSVSDGGHPLVAPSSRRNEAHSVMPFLSA